ncbi:MAG: outer membrane protein assembly factor BamA [candidate division Zixibacteria bacterium]|nr:outer membrane protein assembly factor BamA [candidate division Zixibacteria bacterium]
MFKFRAGIALLVVALALFGVSSEVTGQQHYTVVDISVEGNRIATPSLILGVASLEKGMSLTPTAITECIRRLYGLGIFSDVRIEAEPVTGGLKVYIVVQELPKLIALLFSGNKEIESKDLKEKLRLGVGGYVSPYLIREKKNEIAAMYDEEGYFQAVITPVLSYSEDSTEASLTYEINEKSKVKVEKVILTGNVCIKADDLIDKMRNRKRGFLRSSDFAQDKYDEDLTKIIDECHQRGYIDAYLISDSMVIDSSRNRMTIFLELYEGPRYYFGTADFKGIEVLKPEYLSKLLKFNEGDIFDAEKYDESLEKIYTAYYDVGHLHMRLADIRTTRADSIMDITYDITEGLPSHVNLIKIVGNYKTKEKVIRREISMLPGRTYNQGLLVRSVRDVMALNYFDKVIPNPVSLPNGDVDIEFKIEEKRTGQIMAGAGYNSQDKLVGNVGLGIPNFRGEGQNLAFNVDFGSRRNSFSLSFTEPWVFGRPTLLGISMFVVNRRWFDDYTEGRQGGSVRLGRRLRWPDNYFRIYASYLLEKNRFFDFDDSYVNQNSYKSSYWHNKDNGGTFYDELLSEHYYGPYPGSVIQHEEKWRMASRFTFNITRDSRNLPEFATSGSIASYTFENTGGILGGYWEYQKHTLQLSKFIPLPFKFALAARVQYGVITSPAGDNRILITDRFTPGGTDFDGNVRGYDGGSLTPDSLVTASDSAFFYQDPKAIPGVDPPDDTMYTNFMTRVRGKYMLVTNLELQYPFSPGKIYGLAFFDAGNSWLHRRNIKPITGLYRGVGLGFRIMVPGLGTFGFDFGYALDDFEGEGKGWKPHFQYGTTFR